MKNTLIAWLFCLPFASCTSPVTQMDLSGQWTLCLDSTDVGMDASFGGKLFDTSITLPGTTDEAHLGTKCTLKPALEKPQLLHLTRAYSYVGPAWYSREIPREIQVPSDWKEKDCILHLERVLWDTQVWIDGQKVEGHEESLTTPHEYDLTPYIQPGKKQVLTVRVDNRKRYDMSVNDLAHAYTDATQVKWNGILGDMYIKAVEKTRVESLQLYPDAASRTVKAVVSVYNSSSQTAPVNLSLQVKGKDDSKSYASVEAQAEAVKGYSTVELTCQLGDNAPLWDEFNPYLYDASVELVSGKSTSLTTETFGLRDIRHEENKLVLNDKPIFLRGTLECCIFPLTGTPPTDEASWEKLYASAREYGMNHLRFHSWCPPEAAFNVADEMGFYVQVEEVPLVTHEVGQYSVYPDLTEIPKYTGTLMPLNFMAVKEDLEKKGLIDKAPQYLQASGKLAAILYKEEIERALKTPGISGFQLLDLHDFPGQGTALVGLLNAFWESKGILTGEEFREFCAPVVPLLRFPKAVYTNNETFEAQIELCNYGKDELKNSTLFWEITADGRSLGKGKTPAAALAFGHNGGLGKISFPLQQVTNASKLEVCLSLDGTEYRNRWNVWVYPSSVDTKWGDVKYTRNYDEAMALLKKGEKVLFNPDWRTLQGIEGKFVPVFWSPVHFPNQAGTMGVLCNPTHPALADFPTDMHTDWQWWDLNINSTTLVVDSLQGGASVVEMVDNFVHNRRLTSLYEGRVGEGKLMLATFDLQTALDKRPVARQMLYSILNYMNSEEFAPTQLEGLDKIKDMFGTARNQKQSAKGIY